MTIRVSVSCVLVKVWSSSGQKVKLKKNILVSVRCLFYLMQLVTDTYSNSDLNFTVKGLEFHKVVLDFFAPLILDYFLSSMFYFNN